ncbi:hypothetical protein [Burkholderia sp. Ac-20365]|uniref:hypothetical protein n=1 Tax=Burkholderia sp. Ac-20365 TaxID=2703897 RepID=UPI00197B6F6D|nr:hypothetical protein [Burkholderia sp. Ac-20365]MBN3765282.1 hypothetical protein [Burkholderia sp. Ac-20365]
MTSVELLHNDDEVLDPTDPTLRTRGAVKVDGHGKGSWEEHLDGTWTALIAHETFRAPSKEALAATLETYFSGAT